MAVRPAASNCYYPAAPPAWPWTAPAMYSSRPTSGAIWIFAAGGVVVTDCRVQGITASVEFAMHAGQPSPVSNSIFVGAGPHPPSATQLGHPENFSGTLAILHNDFDVGGMAGTQALGVVMFNVGRSADKEVYIDVSGNRIRNVTEPAINFRVIGGRVYGRAKRVDNGKRVGWNGEPRCDSRRGSRFISHWAQFDRLRLARRNSHRYQCDWPAIAFSAGSERNRHGQLCNHVGSGGHRLQRE